MIKALIITYYWPPSGGAGVQRWLKLSKYLAEFGVEPIVLTVDEKQASYAVLDSSLVADIAPNILVFKTPTNEPFESYKKLLGKKSIPYGGFANETKPGLFDKLARFIRGNFFIPDARVGWNRFAIEKASELIRTHGIDVVITSSPPHSTQLIGLSLKKRFPIKWIADLCDPWTDIYYYESFFHLPFAAKKDKDFERRVIEESDRILIASPPWRQLFQSKTSTPTEAKTCFLPMGYDEADFNKSFIEDKEHFIITYAGTLADSYRPEVFAEALKLLDRSKISKLKVRFVGSVTPAIKGHFEARGVADLLEIVPYVKHDRPVAYLMEGSVLLLAIPQNKNEEIIIPGKIFEYLAAQKPVICLGPVHGESAKIIEGMNAGKAFDRTMAGPMSAYIQTLYTKWEQGEDINLPVHPELVRFSRRDQARQLSEIVKGLK